MKKKNVFSFYDVWLLWETPMFGFLIAVFLCGVFAGGFTGMQISHGNGTYIVQLSDYFVSEIAGSGYDFVQILIRLLEAFSYPLLIVLCGMLTASQFFVSIVIAVRGFLLSFSVAAIISQLGLQGFCMSFASIGVSTVLSVPCLLLIGVAVLLASGGFQGNYGGLKQYFRNLSKYSRALGICVSLLVLAAFLRVVLVHILQIFM